jgi:alginate O-acetyltransferase complex protein AlgI
MLFNSFSFVVFLPLVVALYLATPRRFRYLLLLAASYYFYMCWRVEYISVILVTTAVDYWAGLRIEDAPDGKTKLRYLRLSLGLNLGMLFLFKYAMFAFDGVNFLLEGLAVAKRLPHWDILLPVGISFHTFQSLSYTLDVYYGRTKAERHLGFFALYIAYFPQLMAGPIERADRLIPQLREQGEGNAEDIRFGLNKLLLGFFKKVVVADTLAVIVDRYYTTIPAFDGTAHYLALVLFAMQMFCDFSGYSDIAVGSARLMGVRLMENFNRPFLSRSIAEYWQRWHISLGAWVRDYLFYPLMYAEPRRFVLNTLITFVAIGLWHGASLNFLLFGLVQGIATVLQYTWGRMRGLPQLQGRWGSALRWVFTMHVLLLSGVFFRAPSFADARSILVKLFTSLSASPVSFLSAMDTVERIQVALVLAGLAATAALPKGLLFRYDQLYRLVLLAAIILLGQSAGSQFIYFQF